MMYELKDVLSKSIRKNGNQVLTVQHLLNIVNMIIEKEEKESLELDELLGNCMFDQDFFGL
jgi:hypothetical protein